MPFLIVKSSFTEKILSSLWNDSTLSLEGKILITYCLTREETVLDISQISQGLEIIEDFVYSTTSECIDREYAYSGQYKDKEEPYILISGDKEDIQSISKRLRNFLEITTKNNI